MEQWKKIKGFPYMISDLGNVVNMETNKKISICTSIYGYSVVNLRNKKIKTQERVHRLVMAAFVGDNKLDVNHKNCIKSDNRLVNLEYVTRKENSQHASENGRFHTKKCIDSYKYRSGATNPNAKLTEKEVIEILMSEESCSLLAIKYSVTREHIWAIKTNKTWKHVNRSIYF